ncbi:MAG: CheW protein [Chlamydiales bacterium]|jgi:purine-binding chemotaxis protein CheW|nr:CheW protein [Chlamydiales bacterium]
METADLIQKLSDSRQTSQKEEHSTAKTEEKFIVFSIKEQRYAFYAEQIKEIAFDSEVFFVPFVPPYIQGYINRHGEPYTVFDLRVIFSNEKLQTSKFLIMNLENDQVAFMITDILEILKVPTSNVRQITSDSIINKYFAGSFTAKDSEVFIININNILERLENDL